MNVAGKYFGKPLDNFIKKFKDTIHKAHHNIALSVLLKRKNRFYLRSIPPSVFPKCSFHYLGVLFNFLLANPLRWIRRIQHTRDMYLTPIKSSECVSPSPKAIIKIVDF